MKRPLIVLIGFSLPLTLYSLSSGGEIFGQVTDLLSGSAIAGAKIHLLKEQKSTDYRTTTNYDGKFLIKNIDKGTYDIVINHPNYTEKKVENVEIETNQVTTLTYAQLAMELPPSILTETGRPSSSYGQIRGQVLDKKSKMPLTNAVVRLFFSNGTPAKIGARTKDNGNFIVLSIPPGIYRVEISYGPMYTNESIKDVKVKADGILESGIIYLEEKPVKGDSTLFRNMIPDLPKTPK